MYKKIIFTFKLKLKRLLQKLGFMLSDSERPAMITAMNYEQYFLLTTLINKSINNISKDDIKNLYIVEAGIGFGNTFSYLTLIAEKISTKIIGFDSFCGFPEIVNPRDRRLSKKKLLKGQWNVSSKKSIKEKLKYTGISNKFIINNVELVEGYFEDSLKSFNKNKKIFFLHLDVDLYSSYKTCLEYLWDSVIDGGIIVFDEYHDTKWADAKDAIDEFLKKKNKKVEIDPIFKRGFLIK